MADFSLFGAGLVSCEQQPELPRLFWYFLYQDDPVFLYSTCNGLGIEKIKALGGVKEEQCQWPTTIGVLI
ncbi:hypothetical protein [Photobacterium sanctipauli]|uniref:hypothetical protein n=1 Tax=Photobacterium sanctipauli TaxID=1342794 RepID=UPI000ADB7E9A|nr:hypothetical protein [Photobacterium sanctipauli]